MKILVVGLGSMGRRRLRNLRVLGVEDVSAFEPHPERRQQVADEFGIQTWSSFEAALEARPDALVISTPPDHHTEYALEAARRGIHFFTEASVVSHDMAELLKLVEGKPIVAAPSCTLRFHPSVVTMRERIAAGAIGRVLAVTQHTGQYLPDWHPWEDYRHFYVAKRETGAAREIVPFELIWMTYLFGPIASLSGDVTKVSDLDVDIDDYYAALLRFQSGVRANLVVEVVSRAAVRTARIIGSEGTLVWDWNAKLVREYRASDQQWHDFPEPPPVRGPGGDWVAENMYIEEMRHYVGAITGELTYPYSVREDLGILNLLETIESSAHGQAPRGVEVGL
jgi:predicted dehydrogenase